MSDANICERCDFIGEPRGRDLESTTARAADPSGRSPH
jgi:hypothetical protein